MLRGRTRRGPSVHAAGARYVQGLTRRPLGFITGAAAARRSRKPASRTQRRGAAPWTGPEESTDVPDVRARVKPLSTCSRRAAIKGIKSRTACVHIFPWRLLTRFHTSRSRDRPITNWRNKSKARVRSCGCVWFHQEVFRRGLGVSPLIARQEARTHPRLAARLSDSETGRTGSFSPGGSPSLSDQSEGHEN